MVGYDGSQVKLDQWQYMAAGGASGAITRCIAQPLDVIKIRFQLQVEPIAKGSKYSSVLQAVKTIVKEERFPALWSGHVPAQYLSIFYGVAQFWCYEQLTEMCFKGIPNPSTAAKSSISFSCGAVAGTFATVVSFPFDTVRTRLIAEQKTTRVYTGVWHTLQHMYKIEGRLSMFKGLFPTLAQIAPHSGAQFMFYKLFNDLFHKYLHKPDSTFSLPTALTAGSIAGLLAKFVIYPFDLTKKRLQIQGFQHYRQDFGKQFYCKGFLHCITLTAKQEGFLALYKGLFPSLMKAALVTSLHFAAFEQICQIFRNMR